MLAGAAELVLGARIASRGAWPLHARVANRALAFELRRRTNVGLTDIGPMRAALRGPLLALEIADRRCGWPLEMVLRAANAGWRIEERPVAYLPRMRALEGHGNRSRHGPRGARHGGSPRMRPALVVIAKAPAPGRSKTRLCPPCTPQEAAVLAEAALRDTLDAAARRTGARPSRDRPRRRAGSRGCRPASR